MSYRVVTDEDGYRFEGPGLGTYGNRANCVAEFDAECIARMLARAFEAGKKVKADEVRRALEIVR